MTTVLAVDIGSGGVTSALVDTHLTAHPVVETAWTLEPDEDGVATLSALEVLDTLNRAVRTSTATGPPPDAVVLSSMMHTLVVTDRTSAPLTPVFTWLDTQDFPGSGSLRARLGSDYTRRTGAWCHPSFPAYTIARLRARSPELLRQPCRIHSLRSWIQYRWTGALSEDTSTASASGLLSLESGDWDLPTVDALGLDRAALLPLTPPATVVGQLSNEAADQIGLPDGLPVVAGGGDGFLASLGSGCRATDRLAITLGTSAGVRRFQSRASDGSRSGLFCYRFDAGRFLVGCASNNGGNVLDWAKDTFPSPPTRNGTLAVEPPLFLPFVYGERAPFWDTSRRPRWFEVRGDHTPVDLVRSVLEAVVFVLATYSHLVAETLGPPSMAVLSGNGFRTEGVAEALASLVGFPVVMPADAGTATLRGAASIAFDSIGIATRTSPEDLVAGATTVHPVHDPARAARFDRFGSLYRA